MRTSRGCGLAFWHPLVTPPSQLGPWSPNQIELYSILEFCQEIEHREKKPFQNATKQPLSSAFCKKISQLDNAVGLCTSWYQGKEEFTLSLPPTYPLTTPCLYYIDAQTITDCLMSPTRFTVIDFKSLFLSCHTQKLISANV